MSRPPNTHRSRAPRSLRALALVGLILGAGSIVTMACGDTAESTSTPLPTGELRELVESHLQRAERDPNNARARGRVGLVYEANNMWAEAREQFAHAARLDPSDPIWPLHEAIATLSLGDVDGGLELLRAGHVAYPDCAPMAARLGDMELELGNLEAARKAYQSAAESEPRAAAPLLGLGEVALAENKPEVAIEHLERAVANAPTYKSAHYVLGLAYQAAGRDEDAARELTAGAGGRKRGMSDRGTAKLAELSAGAGSGLTTSRGLLRNGRYREACELLEPLVERFPDNARLRVNLGLALYYSGRSAEGLGMVEESESLDPTYAMTPFNLAGLYLTEGRFEDAREACVRALNLDPSFAPTHGLLGRALFELELDDVALMALGEAMRLAPTDPRPHLTMGELLHRQGKLDEGRAALQRAAELAPQDPAPLLAVFSLEMDAGDLDAAQRALDSLLELAPTHPQTLESQARLNEARGN